MKDPLSNDSALGIVLATLFALVLRSHWLFHQSFTSDELIDLLIAQQSWSEILFLADGFPPLHHLLLKTLQTLTEKDGAARWLSVVYGVLAVPIVGLLAQRVGGRRRGWVAAWLLAISPLHVYFSQEGRAYSLYFLLTTIATWLFWRARQKQTARAWVAFAVVASCVGYAHYYFCFVLCAFALIWLKDAAVTRDWWPGLLALLGISVLQLPLLVLVGYDLGCQQHMIQGNFEPAAIGYTCWTLLAGLGLGPAPRELHDMDAATAMRATLLWLPLVAGLACGILASLRRAAHPDQLELIVLFLLPIAGASAAAGSGLSDYNIRYVIASLLPLVVIMAGTLTTSKLRNLTALLTLTVLAVNTTSIANRMFVSRYQNEDSRAACEFLIENSTNPQRVVAIAHYMAEPVRYYLPADYQVFPAESPVSEMLAVTTEPPTLQEIWQWIHQEEGPYWVFYSREFHGDPEGIFKQALLDDPQVKLLGTWAGVELYRGVATTPSKLQLP